jgi:hypothetical protein
MQRTACAGVSVQGDAVGPVGTRMVLGLKKQGGDGSGELFDETSSGPKLRGDFVAANLGRIELLLKEVIGGEAIGWSSVGALGLDRDARVVRAGYHSLDPSCREQCAGKFAIYDVLFAFSIYGYRSPVSRVGFIEPSNAVDRSMTTSRCLVRSASFFLTLLEVMVFCLRIPCFRSSLRSRQWRWRPWYRSRSGALFLI